MMVDQGGIPHGAYALHARALLANITGCDTWKQFRIDGYECAHRMVVTQPEIDGTTVATREAFETEMRRRHTLAREMMG